MKTLQEQLAEAKAESDKAYADKLKAYAEWRKADADVDKAIDDWCKAYAEVKRIEELIKEQK
jgi:hypothetical protein